MELERSPLRYSRHILLPDVGVDGQAHLRCRGMIVGAGG
jgi:hypothetical protein